jgi:hypothetical protein
MKLFTIDNFYKLFNAGALVVLVYLLSSMFLAPKPYTAELINPNETIEVCIGKSFDLEIKLHVRRTPATIIRTETWFSANTNNNVVWDTFTSAESFNWRDKQSKPVARIRNVTVPQKNSDGTKFQPGEYYFIVNYNSFGVSTPSSVAAHIIAKDCS